MIAASPQRTSVLAVGLERYDWGDALDLPGAADHAVRFARWAADRGVPPTRIRLACSWLEAPAAEPVPGAVTVETTRDGLDTALYALMAEGGDLLLVYWCGHGVTEEGTNRALFTSNAIENAKRNLPLTEIQKLLTSSTGTGFAQVVVVVDACANFLEQLNAERSLPKFTFGELTAREVPLSLYLSTDLGQIAEIDPRLRRATFSTHVIGWLDKAGEGWPPDLDQLRHDVDAAFTERARAGGFRQRPVSVVVRTVGGSEGRVTLQLPARHDPPSALPAAAADGRRHRQPPAGRGPAAVGRRGDSRRRGYAGVAGGSCVRGRARRIPDWGAVPPRRR